MILKVRIVLTFTWETGRSEWEGGTRERAHGDSNVLFLNLRNVHFAT